MNTETNTYVLGLDLDNTAAQYNEGLRTHMIANYGYRVKDFPEPYNYNFTKTGWPFTSYEHYLAMHKEAVEAGLFRALRPMDGVVDAVNELRDNGVHVSVVTHRLLHDFTYHLVASDTVHWLDRVGLRFDSISFSSRKSEIRAHSYVEDAPSNINAIHEAGMKVFAFNKLYNADIEGDRIHSWADDGVEKILAHRAELGL